MDALLMCVSYEFTVKGSRFLAELIPCESQAAARDILKAQKAKYASATHVVHAFIAGAQRQFRGMSDDGEPSGTAGRPVMAVLDGRLVTNAMLTVTRWFGGTLLGTGGLVKAYGDAAKGVIREADAVGALAQLAETVHFAFACDYAVYKKVRHIMASFQLRDVEEQYGEEVNAAGEVMADEEERFVSMLTDAAGGKIAWKRVP